jgi:hypothetical protein
MGDTLLPQAGDSDVAQLERTERAKFAIRAP